MKNSPLTRFFRAKREELRSKSKNVLATHKGLRGSHREHACRVFLEDFLPKRYSVGRGILFDDFGHMSKEADIVIWDDQNFPRLNEGGHTLFFVNSVRCAIGVKTKWSTARWAETLAESKSVRDLVPHIHELDGVHHRLQRLEHQVAALTAGGTLEGLLLFQHHTGTAAIILDGGSRLDGEILKSVTPDPDDALPDLTLFLEPGILIEKLYVEADDRIIGFAGIHRLGADALLGFMIKLQRCIEDRSVGMNDSQHFYESVDLGLDDVPAEGFRFQLSRPPAGVKAVYNRQRIREGALHGVEPFGP
jgi:hypothetical protein